MLSKTIARNLVKGSAAMTRMVQPGNYTCFCGCTDGKHFGNSMVNMNKRHFQGHLNIEGTSEMVPQVVGKNDNQVSLWKDIKHKNEHALVLKTNDEIESYVLSVVRNYFRCT